MSQTIVEIIESERGWGQRVDEQIPFDTHEEAVTYCKNYNTKYNPPLDDTPDWYMYARIVGDNSYEMLRH